MTIPKQLNSHLPSPPKCFQGKSPTTHLLKWQKVKVATVAPKKKIWWWPWWLLVATTVRAATYYVDDSASGANNGSSWTDAWQTFNAINWSGKGGGDIIYIAAGSYGALTNNASGSSAGSRLIIQAAQDGTHSGVVNINGEIRALNRNYFTIDGRYNGARNFVLASGNNIEASQSDDPRIYGCEVSNVGMGIILVFGTGGDIASNKMSGITTDTGIRMNARNGTTAAFDLTFIHNNIFELNSVANSGTGPDGIQACWGMTVYSNTFTSTIGTVTGGEHQDQIQTAGNQYIKIYGNKFVNGGDSMIGCDDSPTNVRIWNNLFITTSTFGTCAIRFYNSTTWTDILIYNNTFVDLALMDPDYGAAIQFTGTSASGCKIINNIFYNCGLNSGYQVIQINGISSTSGMEIDYNVINAGAHGRTTISYSGFGGQVHGQTGAPSFVSYSEGNSGNDYRLAAGDTAAKNNGVSVSSLFTTDADNVTRPQGAAWDIGAFEYVDAAPPVAATMTIGTLIVR